MTHQNYQFKRLNNKNINKGFTYHVVCLIGKGLLISNVGQSHRVSGALSISENDKVMTSQCGVLIELETVQLLTRLKYLTTSKLELSMLIV